MSPQLRRCAMCAVVLAAILVSCDAGYQIQPSEDPLDGEDAKLAQPDAGLSDACPGAISFSRICRLRMIDDFNKIDTVLQVEMLDRFSYTVTDNIESDGARSVPVRILKDGQLEIHVGVPQTNLAELLQRYSTISGDQLAFETFEEHPCTQIETALIYFMVFEWFYYG